MKKGRGQHNHRWNHYVRQYEHSYELMRYREKQKEILEYKQWNKAAWIIITVWLSWVLISYLMG